MNAIPIAVLGASFLGSGHCIAMCGGLIATVARDRRATLRYQLGRLLGYCALGSLAGLLGDTVFQSSSYTYIPWISTLLLTLGFIFLGIRLWKGQPLHLFRLPRKLWQRLAGLGSGTTGLLSALLPCGWLHAFVLGAVATRSASLGALYLFSFWLGTMPALSIAPFVARKIFQPMTKRAPRWSAVILIAIGIANLGMKFLPKHTAIGDHCHHEPNKRSHPPRTETIDASPRE
jgi:sulfite exporter TauE/SafE